MTELDFRILDFIREHFSSGPMDTAMKLFTFLGEAGWLWILIGIVLGRDPENTPRRCDRAGSASAQSDRLQCYD